MLGFGIVLLVLGMVFAFRVGTVATPVLLGSSIVVNALGITMIRWDKRRR